jgi:DNA-binding NtrC family response regulator
MYKFMSEEKSTEKKIKICIVDDDPNIREIYGIKLAQRGFAVITAKDGEEGLEVIKSQHPDIALVDITMPKRNGLELIKSLQEDKSFPKIPIIILTNQDDSETVKKASKLETYFYIVKALATPQKVADTVEEVLQNAPRK